VTQHIAGPERSCDQMSAMSGRRGQSPFHQWGFCEGRSGRWTPHTSVRCDGGQRSASCFDGAGISVDIKRGHCSAALSPQYKGVGMERDVVFHEVEMRNSLLIILRCIRSVAFWGPSLIASANASA